MRKILIFLGATLALASVTPASAHGDYQSSDPAADSTVKGAPGEVTITLTEAPADGSEMVVRDGCKRDAPPHARIPQALRVDRGDRRQIARHKRQHARERDRREAREKEESRLLHQDS